MGSRTRIAITTTTGTSAATAPFTLMSAVTSAQITMIDADHREIARRRRAPPAPGPPTR